MVILGAIEILVVLLVLGVFFGLLFGGFRLAGKSDSGLGRDRASYDNELRMIQEIHAGLERMDERVSSLETVLLERARSQRPPAPPAHKATID
jgi:hypothetical protein